MKLPRNATLPIAWVYSDPVAAASPGDSQMAGLTGRLGFAGRLYQLADSFDKLFYISCIAAARRDLKNVDIGLAELARAMDDVLQ